MYFTSSISNIKLRKTTSSEDVLMYNKNNEFRASYEARVDGEREYNRDYNQRRRDTIGYCKELNMRYEDVLKFNK